jgi:small subunit ribosomal protein S6
MRCYEHTFIARQDLSSAQAQTLAETYAGVVAEHGGEVTKTEYWGLRNLAYRIKKNRKGHYLHLNLKASTAAIDELERQERLSDDVVRYLTVRVDEVSEEPSIIMQVRSSRDDRGRGDRGRRHHDDGPRRDGRFGDRDRPDRGGPDRGGEGRGGGDRGPRASETRAPETQAPATGAPEGAATPATNGAAPAKD